MSNEARRSGWLAAFFVLGMVFMLVIFALARPDLWSRRRAEAKAAEEVLRQKEVSPLPAEIGETSVETPPPVPEEARPGVVLVNATSVTRTDRVQVTQLNADSIDQEMVAPAVQNSTVAVSAPVQAIMRIGRGHRIAGRAILVGEPPAERALPLDPACGAMPDAPKTTRLYRRDENGGLADVIVSIRGGLPEQKWPIPTEPLVIDNRNCQFEPYISGAQVGQAIEITNSDPVMHNAHVIPSARGNREVNLAQMPNGKPVRLSFSEADEAVRIKCDVHPWMFAYVSVFTHPFFAVTDAHGNFEIKNVPAGTYTISANHRKAGAHEMVVEVTEDTSPEMKFSFGVPAKD